MEDKDNIGASKQNLKPFLYRFVQSLLNGLEEDKILDKLSKANDGEKRYILRSVIKENTFSTNYTQKEAETIRNNFMEFKTIVTNVYHNLNYGNSNLNIVTPLSEMIAKFEQLDIFRFTNLNNSRLKDIFDKGEGLLTDEEIISDAINLFKEHNFNFSIFNIRLLSFFSKEKFKLIFSSYIFNEGNDVNSKTNIPNKIDFVGKSPNINLPDILLEVKYRNKIRTSLKDILFQVYENLVKYNNQSKKENYILITVFSNEEFNSFDKLDYSFKKNMSELFPNYFDRIFFIPLSIHSLHLLENNYSNISKDHNLTANTKRTIFRFTNQSISSEFPVIDDHYFETPLNLINKSYEIIINPTSQMQHWRFGIKLSKSEIFPDRTKRHGPGYPIFHLEKNPNSQQLLVSYYDDSGNQVSVKGTSIEKYIQQPIVLIISYKSNAAIIDVLDINKISIIDAPQIIYGFEWFKIFAWADNVNEFEFEVSINEILDA